MFNGIVECACVVTAVRDADGGRRLAVDLAPLRAQLTEIGRRHGRSAAQIALAWVLRHEGVAGAIVGVRTPEEAEELPGVLGITEAELEALAP